MIKHSIMRENKSEVSQVDQDQMPMYERLIQHKKTNPISFHVPGHKNGFLYEGMDPAYAQLAQLDLTELTGLDDLHDPQEVIAEAQRLLADFYQTKKSYFLVNGTTVGNLAMILACCQEGDLVLVQRNCHQSILHGLIMAKLDPIFIAPDIRENGATEIKLQMVEKAFQQYPTIRACIFTYPDYYGQTYDFQAIIDVVHQHHSLVLVDEAHGAHFALGHPFPQSALQLGADIVTQSAHKTLPALTMGSYLHINSDRVPLKKVEKYLKTLQSSSPSYLIMASLDLARHYLAHVSTEDLTFSLRQSQEFIEKVKQLPNIQVIRSKDPLKITVRHSSLSGYELQAKFEQAGVYPELADPRQILLIFPLVKSGMVYPYDQAFRQLQSLSWAGGQARNQPMQNIISQESIAITTLALSYKKMEDLDDQWVDMDESVGKVASQMITPYPPGIPLILAGEKITITHVQQLKQLIKIGARFQGGTENLKQGKLAVFSM
ncbi:aminotransferase class I/II-fold pyridoxal phosphate-dependent enzyme [Lederbergia sp. NSJ-179]|uniref:aminotransferase class I/II-fold pyridoxal phosphate-dependent enzyme n=1 Tax=Lederbergia sp. NSJ-179 TaxID=2931402 RepID=UPI001FD5CA50|nr:aminotransferase class I/II-fold pyridoxal phosphate-dependent enzyme [Lederbergia sp. NSJ-179]MCJ7842932.1 aminotransferase class I/II-fold pyridoxal phosphate-dependent enzyme [Lederbergia sp. NSJ-179]